jgi:predicted S18 family serine protease
METDVTLLKEVAQEIEETKNEIKNRKRTLTSAKNSFVNELLANGLGEKMIEELKNPTPIKTIKVKKINKIKEFFKKITKSI